MPRALSLFALSTAIFPAAAVAITPTNVRFDFVSSATLSISWTLNDPAAEDVSVQFSTASDFSVFLVDTVGPIGLETTSYAVADNTTHYFRVKVAADAASDFSAVLSTLNPSRVPTGIVFDSISSAAVTASAYAPSPAFADLSSGASAGNVAIDGVFAGFRAGDSWTAGTSMTTPREGPGAALDRGRIYVIGGENNDGYLMINEQYDPVGGFWVTKSSMPTARSLMAVAASGGKIYAMGGFNGGSLADNEEYDPLTDSWKVKTPMPTARFAPGVAVEGGKIYVIGGNAGGALTGANEMYDPLTDTWTAKTAMPTARQDLAAAVIDGKIYAVGGLSGAALSTVEEYDPATDSWTAKNSLLNARWRLAAAAVAGKIHAVGGHPGFVGVNEQYDASVDRWVERSAMTTGRRGHAAASFQGRLYAFGGDDGNDYTAVVQAFDPGVGAAFTGLSPNTIHTFKAKMRNQAGVETLESATVSTYTLAAIAPAVGISSFSDIGTSSVTVNWSSGAPAGGYNPAGTAYVAQLSTSPFFKTLAASAQTTNTSTAFTDIDPLNFVYFARVKALNTPGVPSDYLALGPSSIAPGTPLAAATFTVVGITSMTVNWSSGTADTGFNSAGTDYLAELSTDSFSTLVQSSQTANLNALFTSLTPNTTYQARVKARGTPDSAYFQLGPKPTDPAPPTSAAPTAVSSESVTANWGAGGNSSGTKYHAQVSTDSFTTVNASSFTANTFAAFSGLAAGTTHQFRVQALGHSGVNTADTGLPSTTTALSGPGLAADTFTTVDKASVTAAWSAGANPPSVTYTAEVSTRSGFTPLWTSSVTFNLFALFGAGGQGTALTPNTTYFFQVKTTSGAASTSYTFLGSTVTLAALPVSLSSPTVEATSATLSWSLNGNPAATVAELERSTDNAAFSLVVAAATDTYTDNDLAQCTSYFFRVRNRSHDDTATLYTAPLQLTTGGSTPTVAGAFTAVSLAGSKVALSWTPSPSGGVTEYRVYPDSGTGTVDYSSPLVVLSSAATSFTTGVLTSSPTYIFGLRTSNACGVEEKNTNVRAAAGALAELSAVRAVVVSPQSGSRIAGDRVSVAAELASGAESSAASVLFQYKTSLSTAWVDITAQSVNHPNPDATPPFLVHFDVTGRPAGDYDLRAVVTDAAGSTDTAPASITVAVDPVNFDHKEQLVGTTIKIDQAVYNGVENTIRSGDENSLMMTKVVIPAGSLASSTKTLTMTSNPALPAGAPAGDGNPGIAVELALNGQTALSGGNTASIIFRYPDADADGVIDNTPLRAEALRARSYDTVSASWLSDVSTTLDKSSRTITAGTTHLSFFAVFGVPASGLDNVRVYPNPFRPNSGNPDDGKPFIASDPTSGIIFDNLPAAAGIEIYSLTGRLVDSFEKSDDGSDKAQWDGKDKDGRDAASGGYIAVIKSPGGDPVVKKIAIIR